MIHQLLIGIEHLMTGIVLQPAEGCTIQFERESASIVRAISDKPFAAHWPVSQSWMNSTESIKSASVYSHGEAEWYGQVVAPALAAQDERSQITMQTYTRPPRMYGEGRYAPSEPAPFPWAVVRAMRRKFGKDADKWLAELRWSRDHWFFIKDRMYHGVESDGYIHT